MTKRTLYKRFAVYFIILGALMTFPPILSIIDTIEPHILGLPRAQFFILFVAVMIALGLMAFYLAEARIEDREYEMEIKSKEAEANE